MIITKQCYQQPMLLFTVIIILLGFLCFTFLKVDKAFDYCREFISVPERNVRFEVCNYFCFYGPAVL